MARYLVAIDDSGGVEPLINWDGSIKAGDQPVTALAFAVLRASRFDDFTERWNRLRSKIKRALELQYCPPIHLRLMYGRSLPRMYRGLPNPYLLATFDQIVEWIDEAYRIVWLFQGKARTLEIITVAERRAQMAEVMQQYYATPEFRAEILFIKENCPGETAKRYLKRIASPLLELFARGLANLTELLRTMGTSNQAHFILDPFGESHGIDAQSVIEEFRTVDSLSHIESFERLENSDEHALAQVADLMGYIRFRKDLFKHRNEPFDPVLAKIVDTYPFTSHSYSAKATKRTNSRFPYNRIQAQAAFYIIAKRIVEEANPGFANEYMITVHELIERWARASTSGHAGVSILKDSRVCGHLM